MQARVQATETTGALAQFAATLRCECIPSDVREHCKSLVLDALACALAGRLGEETAQVSAFAAALAQGRESSVIGGDHLSLAGATLLNAYLVTAVTMCDVHRATLTHVTPEVVPPALAIAERDGLPGRALLAALAAGCEVTTRIGRSLDYPKFRARGWHGPGVIGPFGAAAAVGSLLGFDADAMARAFALAGSQAAGTFAAWGTPTVKFHQCRGALSGLMAALLAQQGFVATRAFLTAPDGGLYSTYTDGGLAGVATEALGTEWELARIAMRLWPGASLIQGLVTALFDLVGRHAVEAARVQKVRIALAPGAFKMHGGFDAYRGKFEALLSAHYIAAVVLHDRALDLAQFEPARYDDPGLRQFAAGKVTVGADPQLDDAQATVAVETADGAQLFARCSHPLGSSENPISRSQVEQKFRSYAHGRLSEDRIAAVIAAVGALEELESTRTLMDLLRAPARPAVAAAQ